MGELAPESDRERGAGQFGDAAGRGGGCPTVNGMLSVDPPGSLLKRGGQIRKNQIHLGLGDALKNWGKHPVRRMENRTGHRRPPYMVDSIETPAREPSYGIMDEAVSAVLSANEMTSTPARDGSVTKKKRFKCQSIHRLSLRECLLLINPR